MGLTDIINEYLKRPEPLWEYEVTSLLVDHKWKELQKSGLSEQGNYSSARCINDYPVPKDNKVSISDNLVGETICLEIPSFDNSQHFYDEHGLVLLSANELKSNAVLSKLKDAVAIFDLVRPAHLCISKLVKAIQVLKQEDTETDISYSHPKLPFSIFVSVCEDNSMLSNLRVAESILHEAMHLKLTLIEQVVPLVKLNTGHVFFSPWRNEKRPVQGVLHGLFVFRAIFDFFKELPKYFKSDSIFNYLNTRREQIAYEIAELQEFELCPDLTPNGAILTRNLLPLN